MQTRILAQVVMGMAVSVASAGWAAEPGRIVSITPVSLSGKTFELCEFKVEVDSSSGLNPFRQTESAVDADFTLPSGKVMRVPGFYTQDYTLSNHRGVVVPGSAGWRIRFSGSQEGTYRFKVALREEGKAASEKDGPAFVLGKSQSRGMIRIANSAPRYLEYDNGESYFAIGQNVSWTTDVSKTVSPGVKSPSLEWDEAYARWFSKMGQNGANWARIFMKPNFCLEDGTSWAWSLENAWRFDNVVEIARKNGIYINMCMNLERGYEPAPSGSYGHIPWHPFGFKNTTFGPLLSSRKLSGADFTVDPLCQEMYRDKLRYTVARWGYSPQIASWEIWNEIECFPAKDCVPWMKRTTAYLRRLDPWHHLVKSSSHYDTPAYWNEDCGDLNDRHGYYGWQGFDRTRNFGDFYIWYTKAVYEWKRPFILGETGIALGLGSASPDAEQDTTAFHIHECLWSGLFAGSVGTGMPWWWDECVDLPNAYWRFQAIANFVKGVRFNHENFVRGTDVTATDSLKVFELTGEKTRLLWVRHPDLSWYGVAVEKKTLTPITHARLSLTTLARGNYVVEIWSSEQGKMLSSSMMQVLSGAGDIVLPPIKTEVAIKIIAKG